jgi:hypothetical protein
VVAAAGGDVDRRLEEVDRDRRGELPPPSLSVNVTVGAGAAFSLPFSNWIACASRSGFIGGVAIRAIVRLLMLSVGVPISTSRLIA